MRKQDLKNKEWEETQDGRRVKMQQIAGKSGVYLVVTDIETGEVLRDGRPWQMQAGVS